MDPEGTATSAGDVFAAMADPTRRQIYEQLTSAGPSTATMLAGDLDITRQAVAKHLGILASAGMASSTKVGRETRFEAHTGALSALQQWVRQVEGEWSQRLKALAASLEKP